MSARLTSALLALSAVKNMASLSRESVCIRSATLDDTRYIAELKIDNHHNMEKFDVLNYLLSELFVCEYKKRWQQKIKDGMHIFVLFVEDNMVGFIGYTSCYKADAENTVEINDIYLIPQMRGKQLGRLLWNATLKNIRQKKFSRAIVWLVESRRQTRKFYEAMGFKMTSTIKEDIINEHVILREIMYEMMLMRTLD
jgi:L-amino acid N-acyltransferase YncA